MKSFLVFLGIPLVVLLVVVYFMGYSQWHLQRNQHNQLPKGQLRHLSGDDFIDEAELVWELQPAIKNKFHQPKDQVEMLPNPYPLIVDTSLKMDRHNPNLKFLCQLENGASYEAILQPNGSYLTEGKKRGTYNYGHPGNLIGIIKHTIWDVLPHFANANYE